MMVLELYWDAVSRIAAILDGLIVCYFFYRFTKPFLQNSKYAGMIGIVYGMISIPLDVCVEISGSVSSAMGVAAAFLMMCLLDKRNIEQKIFLAVIYYLLNWVSWGLLVAIWNASYDVSMHIPVIMKSVLLQFADYVIRQILWLVVEFWIMRLFTRILHRVYTYKKENMTKRELVLVLAPFVSLIAGRFIFRYFVDVYEMDLKQYVWENHPGYNLLLFLYQTISFLAMLTVIIIYQSIKAGQRVEKEDTVLARQIEDMERHIGEVEKLYRDIRSMKHDMKNHVMVLENLYGEDKEAGKYAAQLKEQIDGAAWPVDMKSGNPVTDIIMREKQKEAEEKGIAFQYDFHYPEYTKLNAFDVSVVLSNALNNAIEAAAECGNPYVNLFSYCKNNAYMIEIKNSMMGGRVIDEDSGLPVTTKKDGGHGFGLANIRKVAQKYYGDIAIEQSEKEFALVIMLMIA